MKFQLSLLALIVICAVVLAKNHNQGSRDQQSNQGAEVHQGQRRGRGHGQGARGQLGQRVQAQSGTAAAQGTAAAAPASNVDSKCCGKPLQKSDASCCKLPELLDATVLAACQQEAKSAQRNGARSGDQKERNNGANKRRGGQSVRGMKKRGGEKLNNPCVLQCAFKQIFNDVDGIESADIPAITESFKTNAASPWNADDVTAAVSECVTNVTAAKANFPTPPTGVQNTCMLDFSVFMKCVKRSLTLKCPASITETYSDECKNTIIPSVSNCDPLAMPPPRSNEQNENKSGGGSDDAGETHTKEQSSEETGR